MAVSIESCEPLVFMLTNFTRGKLNLPKTILQSNCTVKKIPQRNCTVKRAINERREERDGRDLETG